jgi:Tol biopolymer transport system component
MRTMLRWSWRLAAYVLGGAAVLALIVIAAIHLSERPARQAEVRFDLNISGEMELQDFAVSPDGHAVAYTAIAADGEPQLSIRPLDVFESRVISGTDGAAMPFWSPDSRHIGFFARGKLKTVRIDGGPPVTIADALQPHGGTWNRDGTILFASGSGSLQRVSSAGGGTDRMLIAPADPARGPGMLRWPQFLPDGRHFLFSAGSESSGEVRIGSLDSSETRVLTKSGSAGVYSGGGILFLRDALLMAQPFDMKHFELTGEPQPVGYAESIGIRANRAPPYSVGGGVLAYREGAASTAQILLWLDRTGKVTQGEKEPSDQDGFALSPESNALSVVRPASGGKGADLWWLDVARGAAMRLTFDAREISSPVWSPDGSTVAFISRADNQSEIRSVSVKAPGASEVLMRMRGNAVLDSWSPDGKFFLYTAANDSHLALWLLQLSEHKPVPFLSGNFNFKQARFSPDNRWVAYVSDESGRDEVYVRQFPSGQNQSIVSVDGGTLPAWRRDGREIFYLSPQRQLTSVEVRAEPNGFRSGTPQPLLRIPPGANAYEVTADGLRFLIAAPAEPQRSTPIHIVLNWSAER